MKPSLPLLFGLCVVGALPLNADTPQITDLVIEPAGPCVRASFRVDLRGGQARVGMYFGETPNPSSELGTRRRPSPANSSARTVHTCSLPPSAKIYIQPFASDSSGQDEARFECTSACTQCDFGAGATAATCEGPGRPPYIETEAFEGFEEPALPEHAFDPMIEPAIDGQTFTVDCQGGVATNFSDLVRQAAAANAAQWHKVAVPAGCKVKERLVLPGRNGAANQGGILITTQSDPALLPPAGVRIDPTFRPALAKIEAPADYSWFGPATATARLMRSPSNGSGYRFQNIEIGLPDFREMPVRRLELTGASASGNAIDFQTGYDANEFAPGQQLLLDMQGCSGLQGYAPINNTTDSGLRTNNFQVSGQCSGGTGTLAVAWPLAECAAGPSVRCTTTVPHGIPNLEALSIRSIERDGERTRITLNAPMHNVEGNGTRYLLSGDTVRVEGSGTPLDGRLLQVLGANAEALAVPLQPDASCSGDCGTVREIHPIDVFKTGNEDLDGTHHFRVVDERTIELEGVSLAQTVSSGYLTYDPPASMIFLDWSGSKRIVFDRVLLDCGSFPFRTRTCMSLVLTEESAVVNSYVRGSSYWLPMDPLTKSPRSARDGDRSFNPQVQTILFSGAKDLQIRNNTIYDAHGLVIFADQVFRTEFDRQGRDVTVQRTTVHNPYRFLAGHPESDGHYYQTRHCFEAKSAKRLLLEGLRCSGNWADWTPGGPAILISVRGGGDVSDPIVAEDITIRGSVIERSASGIELTGETIIGHNTRAVQRVDIAHNIFADIDFYTNRSAISGVNGLAPSSNFGGYLLFLAEATANIRFRRNTVGFQRGKSTEIMHLLGEGASIVEVEDNILNFSHSDTGVYGFRAEGTHWQPGCDGMQGQGAFRCMLHRMGKPDPLTTFDGNVIYGCLKQAGAGERAQVQARIASAGDSLGRNEARNYFGGLERDRPNDYLESSGARTCAERLNEVFQPGTFIPQPRFDGKGADPTLVKRYLGEVGEVSVTTGATEVHLLYETSDEQACWVDYSTDAKFLDVGDITRFSDGGGTLQRDVTLSNLQPNTNYAYRILCAAQQPRGVFKTQ